MAHQNSYLKYKRDTRLLTYWILHNSNSIIKDALETELKESNIEEKICPNTTGEIKVSQFVPLSKLIAKHISTIPHTIYRLFQSVIAERTAAYAAFQRLAAKKADSEIQRSNASHKRFIDVLTEAFHALGGDVWASTPKTKNGKEIEEDLEAVIFSNKFAALNINTVNTQEGEMAAEVDSDDESQAAALHPNQRSKGKGKKGKKGKGGKKAKKPEVAVKEPSLEEVPIESYRIIEDESGIVTDYLMAVYSLVTQWIELRGYIQGLWHEVAYDGLNSAVAGTMSNIAISMIKQSESAIFIEFPGHDSFETVTKTITRGSANKAQGMFVAAVHEENIATGEVKVQETVIDIKEQFMIHVYQDLLDFITDFKKTRTGKPTEPILTEISGWNPDFNLQEANKKKRIKWRRAYTINWLYDLVNVFSSIVVKRNRMKGQDLAYENVNWSIDGPWSRYRRLFGLCEFAGEVTTLAMQMPATDVRSRISPHLVFQLACIVDSLAVSRGWSCNTIKGHVLSPPAYGFRPRRDVDLFMDRENVRQGHGHYQPVDFLIYCFQEDAELHGDPDRHRANSAILVQIRDDFENWLGESSCMKGLTPIRPSLFSNIHGLWEYSPFLCGVGLMEALQLVYAFMFQVWDEIPEPTLLVHLNNMLIEKGYIGKEIGLFFGALGELFPEAFFADGKPMCDFGAAFLKHTQARKSHRLVWERRQMRRQDTRTAADIHGVLNTSHNRLFKQKSFLNIYREAGYIPERVPDDIVPVPSALAGQRIGSTKLVVDSATGSRRFEDTDLVKRARAAGFLNDNIVMQKLSPRHGRGGEQDTPENLRSPIIPEGSSTSSESMREHDSTILSISDLLEILKTDVVSDICGARPVDSLNYVWATVRCMRLFTTIESELKTRRNPLWVRAYEEDPLLRREKRASLTSMVLHGDDDETHECMEVIAEALQKAEIGFTQHIYWNDLLPEPPRG